MHIDPVVEEYVPATQSVQVDALSADDDPAAHFVHDNAPFAPEYVPARQATHDVPFPGE